MRIPTYLHAFSFIIRTLAACFRSVHCKCALLLILLNSCFRPAVALQPLGLISESLGGGAFSDHTCKRLESCSRNFSSLDRTDTPHLSYRNPTGAMRQLYRTYTHIHIHTDIHICSRGVRSHTCPSSCILGLL